MTLNLELITEILNDRGFRIVNLNDEFITAIQSSLVLRIWLLKNNYLEWYDPLIIIEKLGLQEVDALIIISQRPHHLIDEVFHSIIRARYWYGIDVNARVYAVDENILEKHLEEVLNTIITQFTSKISNTNDLTDYCPHCFKSMTIKYSHKHKSSTLNTQVIELVLVCNYCGVRIHRAESILTTCVI